MNRNITLTEMDLRFEKGVAKGCVNFFFKCYPHFDYVMICLAFDEHRTAYAIGIQLNELTEELIEIMKLKVVLPCHS